MADTTDYVQSPTEDVPLATNPNSDGCDDSPSSVTVSSIPQTRYCCSSKLVEVLLCFVSVPIAISLEFATPYERPVPRVQTGDGQYIGVGIYDLSDEGGETVSSGLMFIVGIAVPFLLQVGLICWKRQHLTRTDPIHKTCCVYFMAIGCNQMMTNFIKLYVGYLRPIFYELCQPDEDYEQCTSSSATTSSVVTTSGDYGQGRKSFPSGHASLSVCGLLLFSFFLEDTFGLSSYLRKRANATSEERKLMPEEPTPWVRLGSVFCYMPMVLALFIAASRVHDNHHHPADVVGGALLGGSIASLMFGIWFR